MTATAARPTPAVAVVALPDGPLARRTGQLLRRRGWEVRPADAACAADAVVLPAEGDGESGWLACAKLTYTRPGARVVLVGERTPANLRLARFVRAAALVGPDAGPDAVAAALGPR